MMIGLRNVTKSFDGKTVFADTTVSFPEGKTTNIMGASGCGKTTLLRLLAGLLHADSGTVEKPSAVAFVFQEDRLCEDFSAVANIRLVTGSRLSREAILRELAALGLAEDSALAPVRTLSGGMKRRVAIARAVLADAPVVLLDEAFKGLDAALRETVIAYVRKKTAGRTVLNVTHSEDEAGLLGGEIWRMGGGAV
ncbi:MAG: ATP-binding cassette domain-containing protein [Oscillospiraceae bacterium]|nr:ATP-binding cassette domain-containing protein [Oscillospiraceae bacterium]